MPTMKGGYRLPDGTRIPSVTQVLGSLGWSKAPLMHWAWKEGRDGRDYRESRQRDADIGTIAHALIERHLTGHAAPIAPETPADMLDAAQAAFGAFLDWWEEHDGLIFRTELPIVCPVYRYGGTLDATANLDGRFVLLDWKTSKAVYGEYVLQVAAYRHLWNEYQAMNEQQIVEDAVIVRVGKDGQFRAYELHSDQLDEAFRVFRALVTVHSARTMIDAMVNPPEPKITKLPVTRKAVAS